MFAAVGLGGCRYAAKDLLLQAAAAAKGFLLYPAAAAKGLLLQPVAAPREKQRRIDEPS